MEIRLAKSDELNKLVAIYQREGLQKDVVLVSKHASEEFKEIGSKRIIWFAEENNLVIGAIQLILNSQYKDMADGRDTAMIHHIRVDVGYQGQGIGKKLLEITEHEAQKRGFKQITLEVEKTNVKAKEIYEHLNYIYVKDGRNPKEIVMMKQLDNH